MNRRILTIVLAVILIGCFFLPYLSSRGNHISGYDFVFSGADDWKKYIPLLIPISGAFLLIGALNNGNYILGRGLWAWLPLLTLLYMMIGEPLINGVAFGDIFKHIGENFGYGLWVTIGASLVLAVYNPRN
ncbi:MAG: hypothetical protein ABIR30_08570 [Chitinophagaceae bacterium]